MNTKMKNNNVRIGIDVGGTFTDFALAKDGVFHTTKLLTTHQAPEQAILEGLQDIMAQTGTRVGEVESIIHGTTLATNAIIEQKGARVAMLTTQGFRDVIELTTESRFDQYDLQLIKPEPLVPRHLRFTIKERLAADGRELLPLDVKAIKDFAAGLRENNVDSLAICFLHSFVDARHEHQAAEELLKYLPDLYISLFAEVAPVIREYERFSTTVANAYVQPLIDAYLKRLQTGLKDSGFDCPLFMFLSNGGLAEVDIARKFPIRLVESGPAGGAVFASHIARKLEEERIVSFDMGGTTAKLCLIDEAEPQKSELFEMARVHRFKQGSGLPARIPVIEMVEIGAGGGSIARVDNLGRITVGPDSAGSEPGPACYDRGGQLATVTDSDLILGHLEADGFADGTMKLQRQHSEKAIHTHLAGPLKMEIPYAAYGVAEIVDEEMANAAREHATENGKTVGERSMVAFGGAAPIHALALAKKLGIKKVIIPPGASVGSAVGFLLAPVSFELSRSCLVRLSQFKAQVLEGLYTEMSAAAHRVVASAAPDEERSEIRQAQMRYVGQGYNIAVNVSLKTLEEGDREVLEKEFNDVYRGLYKKLHEGVDIEIVGVSVAVSAQIASVEAKGDEVSSGKSSTPPHHDSELFNEEEGQYRKVAVYLRHDLLPGKHLNGPLLIRDQGTTIVVPEDCSLGIASDYSLLIERGATS